MRAPVIAITLLLAPLLIGQQKPGQKTFARLR
jgi:hypothetical protein